MLVGVSPCGSVFSLSTYGYSHIVILACFSSGENKKRFEIINMFWLGFELQLVMNKSELIAA
jgi:hypothetical protein